VLFVDGEMPSRLIRKRLQDLVRRLRCEPENLFILSREDYPDMPPLNTEAGQQFIDALIEWIGGADIAFFDNIQALLTGDMKEEDQWRDVLPWSRDLTRHNIGQVWIHHTGLDETHGYGSKAREWQLDTVILLERVNGPERDIAFGIKFLKARERTPDNRSDFDPAIITLVNDEGTSERGGHLRTKRQAKDRALELLREAITREGTISPACAHIPPETLCVTVGVWRKYCQMGCVTAGGESAERKAFQRASEKLLKAGLIGKWDF
jgi:hypothetical protein